MEFALYTIQIIVGMMLIALVVIQARTPGMAGQSGSSIHHTRRGLEKTMHQVTVGLSVSFLVLAIINSLPLFR